MNINIIYTDSSSGQVGFESSFPSNINSITLDSVNFLVNHEIDSFSIPEFGIYCSKTNPSANSIGSASLFSGKSSGGHNVQVLWTGTANPNNAIAVLQVSYTTGESGSESSGESGSESGGVPIYLNKQFVKPGEELQVTAYVPYGRMHRSYIVSSVNENKTPSSPFYIYSFININNVYQTHCSITIPSSWEDDSNAKVIIGEEDAVVSSANFKIGEMPFPTAGTLDVSSTSSLNNLYFQWSDIKFQLNNVEAGDETTTISSVYFQCGSNSYQAVFNQENETYDYTINSIEDFGELTYYATVTNSYGASINTESSILNVKEYNKPQIEFLQATRINGTGEIDASGNYIKVDVTPNFFSWTTSGEQSEENILTSIKIFYSDSTQETWYPAKVLNTDDEEFINILNKKFEIQNRLSSEATIYVKVEVKDRISMTSEIVSADLGTCTLFFDNGGENVSIGMFGSKQRALEINPQWKIYHGDNEININYLLSQPIKTVNSYLPPDDISISNYDSYRLIHTSKMVVDCEKIENYTCINAIWCDDDNSKNGLITCTAPINYKKNIKNISGFQYGVSSSAEIAIVTSWYYSNNNYFAASINQQWDTNNPYLFSRSIITYEDDTEEYLYVLLYENASQLSSNQVEVFYYVGENPITPPEFSDTTKWKTNFNDVKPNLSSSSPYLWIYFKFELSGAGEIRTMPKIIYDYNNNEYIRTLLLIKNPTSATTISRSAGHVKFIFLNNSFLT